MFLWDENEKDLLFTAPSDILERGIVGGSYKLAKYDENLGYPYAQTEGAYESVKGKLIYGAPFKNWILGKEEGLRIESIDRFIKKEPRVGIALDRKSGTAREKHLYFHERLRFGEINKDIKLCFISEKVEVYEGFVGGERNPCEIQEELLLEHIEEILFQNLDILPEITYKFYILTHTYISDNLNYRSKPVISLKDKEGKLCKFKILWLFSAGTEIVSGRGKPFINTIKPGSVFILKALEECNDFRSPCQIYDYPNVLNTGEQFLKRGWNTGILIKEGGEKK
ncbi:hypothetical protein JCM9492_05160 [Aquifex pyrophilus]